MKQYYDYKFHLRISVYKKDINHTKIYHVSLQKYPFMDILPEPLEKWTNLDGFDLLELIYKNPKRWGLTQVRYCRWSITSLHV